MHSRRHFLTRSAWGLGSVALASLLAEEKPWLAQRADSDNDPMAPRKPHFPPKAKAVIFLGQIGAPSQLDLFDYKPELQKRDEQPVPDEIVKGQSFVFIGQGKT